MFCVPEREEGTVADELPVADHVEAVWFCARTHQKREHIAAAQLSQIEGLEVFNPQLKIERRTKRGPMLFIESLFSNYIFARAGLEKALDRVRFTPSIKAVVQFGERVATIPDAAIEELRKTLAEYSDCVFVDTPCEGEEAEVSNGPFQGEKGRIVRILPARERVEILLEIMGRPLSAEFHLSSIVFKHRNLVPHDLRTGEDGERFRR
jgi:transcription antitermination factor NusG